MTAPQPVLVGAGEVVDKPEDPMLGLEPLALMETAARRACDDAGGGAALLAHVDTVAVVTNVFHDYGDTATLLAARLGCGPGRRLVTTWGGNTPQSLTSFLCDEVAAGRCELALVAGAEAVGTLRALGKRGIEPAWTPHRATDVPRWGDMRSGTSDLESRHGMREAYVTFALVENAFRASRGLSLDDARREIGAFAERCTRVAADNPYAWFPEAKDAATLTTATPSNRMVAFPYPKYLNAIMEVNQGAALLVASDAAARRLGITPDRWVHPWAAADVTEQWYLSERTTLHALAGTQRAAAALFETIGRHAGDVTHLDLYSCFPIAPRLSAATIGLDPGTTRPLTVTGGLPWFGGPGNNYGTHALAAMMRLLRRDRGATGFLHGLGWSCTKHALAVLGGSPSPQGWRRVDTGAIQAWVDAQPSPEVVAEADGPGTIETYTVVHGRDGAPERGAIIGRLPDAKRFLATLAPDRDAFAALEASEGVGRRGTVRVEGGRNVFHLA
ncbi:MAG TPA: acetyl-CoA acetyltransferase [Candidatus Eisenbacteria bacterium]|nr:acetyl-CoA acetyltransferase [Candidatus Eisenbacteria bacterium]